VDFKLSFSRLTGRHVLGPGVFWSTLGFSIVAHALGSSDLGDEHILARLASVAIAHLAMMAAIYLTKFLGQRLHPGFAALIPIALGYILAGVVRGLVLQYSLFSLGLVETGFSTYRAIGGVVVMTSASVWAAFAFGLKAEWGAKRSNLETTKQQLESLLKDSETRLESEATDTMSTIESMLQTALLPELEVSPRSVLLKLQSLINDTLRPLSTSLVANQPKIQVEPLDKSAHQFRWRTVLTHLTLRESSRAATISIILSTLAVSGFVRYVPEVNTYLLLAISIVVLFLVFSMTKHLLSPLVDRLPAGLRTPLVFAILFGIGFGGGMAVLWMAHDEVVAVSLSINGGIAAALLGALFGINQAATKEMRAIEQQLTNYEYRLRWTIAALNCQHWMQKKQFARKIHGPIQSEVAAAAIRIERNMASGEVTESGTQALQNLRDRLTKILADTKGTAELRPVLAEIAETWHGLCEIEFELSEDLECALRADSVCVETVLEIAREACSNAIRHGSAQNIRLAIAQETDELVRISVKNDGTGLQSDSRPGVGSAYLDDCTFSHELSKTDSGTLLTATVPFRAK
jgi:signal transduction histidine kinase